MRRFPWLRAIYLLLVASVLADLLVWRGPVFRWIQDRKPAAVPSMDGVVARVGDETISLRDLEETLRDQLWRRGETWEKLGADRRDEIRRIVADDLINDRLIRWFRRKEQPAAAPASLFAARDELAMFAKQFERAEDYEARLSLRQLDETALTGLMRESLEDQAWLESRLSGRTQAVTDQDVEQWASQHPAVRQIPPVYAVAHIYLTTHDPKLPDREAEIREIHRQLTAGEATFEQLAERCSEDERTKKHGGVLGWISRVRMPGDFMDAVAKLEKGAVSEPVRTGLGWHVIRVIDRKPAREAATAELKGEVSAFLTARRREAALRSLLSELRAGAGAALVLNEDLILKAEPPHGTKTLEDPEAKAD